jgi:hypothetical protein
MPRIQAARRTRTLSIAALAFLLTPNTILAQASASPASEIAVGIMVPVDVNGSVHSYGTAGNTGVALGLWADAAIFASPSMSLRGTVEIARSYQRGYRTPGGGSIEAMSDHRDTVVGILAGYHLSDSDRLGALVSAGPALAFSQTVGTFRTVAGGLIPGPPVDRSIEETRPAVVAGIEVTARLAPRTALTFGTRGRWVWRSQAERQEGIGRFGLTPRVGLVVRF